MRSNRRGASVVVTGVVLSVGLFVVGVPLAPAGAQVVPPGTVPAPAPADPAAAASGWTPPVSGPVVDPFRPPPVPWAPGNRGVDIATAPGSVAVAAASGTVLFAGSVAGWLHVTVRHGDGLRTTVSFLATVDVVAGQQVQAGQRLGLTGPRTHVGMRNPAGDYLDPTVLWGQPGSPVRLVPGGDDGTELPPLAAEAASLWRTAWDLTWAVGEHEATRLQRRTLALGRLLVEGHPMVAMDRMRGRLDRWADGRADCTSPDTAPPLPAERRILVMVAGFTSSSDHSGMADFDAASLGYDPGDAVVFSYNGGIVPTERPGGSAAAGLTARAYSSMDSQRDVTGSAAALAELLAEVAADHPGVPIDVVAHSQGGLVSRLALDQADRSGRLPATVQTLVTLASPHDGAVLATAAEAIDAGANGPSVRALAARAGFDPELPAWRQLAEGSEVVAQLDGLEPPTGIRFTTVGVDTDLVVPAASTDAAGSRHVEVSLDAGVNAHAELPRSAAARREVALAVAGWGPTCRSVGSAVTGIARSEVLSQTERGIGLGLAVVLG